jgi:hypothetical protein
MYTRKSSGASQSVLMQWLTDKTKNMHFNMDASGIGHKFFIAGTGQLFASLPAQASLASPIIDRVVHMNSAAQQ